MFETSNATMFAVAAASILAHPSLTEIAAYRRDEFKAFHRRTGATLVALSNTVRISRKALYQRWLSGKWTDESPQAIAIRTAMESWPTRIDRVARRRAFVQERATAYRPPALPRDPAAISELMCPFCGLETTEGIHLEPEACISSLRDRLAKWE